MEDRVGTMEANSRDLAVVVVHLAQVFYFSHFVFKKGVKQLIRTLGYAFRNNRIHYCARRIRRTHLTAHNGGADLSLHTPR